MTDGLAQVFAPARVDGPLRQGEILSGLTVLVPDTAYSTSEDAVGTQAWAVDYALVLSPECDLLRAFEDESAGEPPFPPYSATLCVGLPFADVRKMASESVERLRKNTVPRWGYVREVPPHLDLQNVGLTELGFDFRQTFTLPAEAIRANGTQIRRAVLQGNYALHIVQRYLSYAARVPLDLDHHVPVPSPLLTG